MTDTFTLILDPIAKTATIDGIPIELVAGLTEILSNLTARVEALEREKHTHAPSGSTGTGTGTGTGAAIPDWLIASAQRIGEAFNQVYLSTDNGIASFRNGNTTTVGVWETLSYPDQEALIGVRYNGDTNSLEVI